MNHYMNNYSEKQYFLMATTDPEVVIIVGWSNSGSQIQSNWQSLFLYKSIQQIMGLSVQSIVQQYAKVDYLVAEFCDQYYNNSTMVYNC